MGAPTGIVLALSATFIPLDWLAIGESRVTKLERQTESSRRSVYCFEVDIIPGREGQMMDR